MMSKCQITLKTLAVTLDLNAQMSYPIPEYLCLQWSSQAHLLGAEFTPGPAQKTLWTGDLTEQNDIKWVHEADLTEASWTPTVDQAAKFSGPVCTVSLSCKHENPVFKVATLQVRLGHMFTSKRHTCQAHLFEVKNPLCSLTNQQLSRPAHWYTFPKGQQNWSWKSTQRHIIYKYHYVLIRIEDMRQIFTDTKPN